MKHLHSRRKLLKQVPGSDDAKRLAEDMQAKGHAALHIEVEKSSGKSLKFLEHFRFLKHLDIGGHARDLETVAALAGLQELCLLRVTVPDFRFLAGLDQLRLLDMRFGGCKEFDSLAVAKHLVGVNLLRLPSLMDLGFVASMPGLELLELDSCKGVTRLPDFSHNPQLRKIVLMNMNGLLSLEGCGTAQCLEHLVVGESKTLPPTEFKRVSTWPAIRKVLVGLALTNSARYKEAITYVPEDLRMNGYYGTVYEEFSFRGYQMRTDPVLG